MSLITCPRCSRQVTGGKFCPGCGARLDDPLVGRVLGGKWKLGARVAKGPFYATYRAEPKAGGVPVSVKILDPGLAGDDGRRRRFLENAGAGLSLMHPAVLSVREMADERTEEGGQAGRIVFAVADAPGGPSLADVVLRQGALDPARACALLRNLLEALGSVHGAGMAHGDLHPGCVFLEPDGAGGEQVRLGDAGLAPGLASAEAGAGDPGVLGSDGGRWISPEQASGRTPVPTAEGDVHAAGAILYFALTGVAPWQAEKGSALLFEIQRSYPRAASEARAGVPATLDPVLDRALSKAPAERFASAADFARALSTASANLRAGPAPALPDDVTPGALTAVGGTSAAADLMADVTMTAPPKAAPPPDRTMTAGMAAPVVPPAAPAAAASSADETVIGFKPPRTPAPPAPEPTRARAPLAPTAPVPASGADAPPPPPPGEAPPPKPQRADPPMKLVSKPPGKAAAKPAAKPAAREAPPEPAAPGKRKARGPWSVGTPVGVLAVLLFLGVGALYGAVWAGYLDWQLPPWVRVLTGRNETPHAGGGVAIEPQALTPITVFASLDPSVQVPLSGEGKDAVYGHWTLERDPPEGTPPAEGGAPPMKVYATGDFRGEFDATGGISQALLLPAGRYRLHGTFRYGVLDAKAVFEVKDKPETRSFTVVRGTARLVVNLQPTNEGKVKISWLNGTPLEKTSVRGEGVVQFGFAKDGEANPLRFGDQVQIEVEAAKCKPASRAVRLLHDPEIVTIQLEESDEQEIAEARQEIQKSGRLSPKYENNPSVLSNPGVIVDLATVASGARAWVRVEDYLEQLDRLRKDGPVPEEALPLYEGWHAYLGSRAEEAAARGDLDGVRLARAKARPDALGPKAAALERARWAEREARAWLNYPAAVPPEGTGGAEAEITPLARMVKEDLGLLAQPLQDALRRDVARRILLYRAWPAWRAGNELRPPTVDAGDPPGVRAIPGPSIQPWIDLALQACPDLGKEPSLLLSLQRLEARLEDLESRPERVVRLLLGDPEWKPSATVPDTRLNQLFKKDRLLLARALRQWGTRQRDASIEEANQLWQHSWNTYLTCETAEKGEGNPDREFPEALAAQALRESVDMALKIRGNDSALVQLAKVLKLRPGDEVAQAMQARLMSRDLPRPSIVMDQLKMEMVAIPEGDFQAGTGEIRPARKERPFNASVLGELDLGVLPARTWHVFAFLVSAREVTCAQYRAYLREMADPAKVRLYAHPDEPEEKRDVRNRTPAGLKEWADEDPVRGVDWWDAYACCRYLGGRLPTEVEWEMAARWCGRPEPAADPMAEFRARFEPLGWSGFWPTDARNLSVFDRAPSGARGFWGGVAEWTLDRHRLKAPAGKGTLELLVDDRPDMKPEKDPTGVVRTPVMAVRGGSYYHQPPGNLAGESEAERNEREARTEKTPPGPGEKDREKGKAGPPPEEPHLWQPMDLLDRRPVPGDLRAKWIGFRVVLAADRSKAPPR